MAGGVCFAIFCGKDRFDRFGTWPSNQRYKRFDLRYTVETAMIDDGVQYCTRSPKF